MNLFDAIFKDSSDATAVLYEQTTISYADLRERTLSMAKAIGLLDTEPGDRIALLLNDSPEFIEAFIAICSMGRIAVPINMALRIEEQMAIIDNCRARAAIVEDETCNAFSSSKHCPEELVAVVRAADESRNDFELTEAIRREPATRLQTLAYLKEQSASNDVPDFLSPAERDVAFILYTSGSTGEPKGAMHRQSDIFYTNDTFCREVLNVTPDDRLFSSSRLPFAYGLGNSFTFPLLNGATSILCRQKPTAEIISQVLSDARPTIFFAVPVVYNLLLERHRERPLDCSSLRLCVSAGEALPAHLGEQWQNTFGVPCLDGIGSTEMLHMFMSNHLDDVRYGSSGRVLKGYEARLLDQNGTELTDGTEGNLWIKGASAASGYWERPDETERTFVDGWVRTGDLYKCDADGYWFHMGRSDDCFKSSGQWVSPVEVEALLSRHDGVARVAVVEDFDDKGLPCPCAFVVTGSDVSKDVVERELRELTAASLPRFKQPRRYVFVSELAYTVTGKIQRFKLRQQLRRRSSSA